jgi:uncharacterized membrane protein
VDGSLHGRESLEGPRIVPEPAKHRLPRAVAAALWVARAILAGVLGAAGALKVYAPLWAVASTFAWIESVPPDLANPATRLAGVAELAAAVALVVPRWNDVVESLSRVAVWAGGVAAAIETLPLLVGGDRVALRASVAVAGLAAFVAWGRLRS